MKKFIISLLMVFAIGCGDEPVHTASVDNTEPLTKQLGSISLVYSDRTFPPETPLEIKLGSVPQGARIRGKIVGTNMSMGTIPLFFVPTADGQWSGQFMLGACAEPVMHWKLQVEVTNADGVVTEWQDTFEVTRR